MTGRELEVNPRTGVVDSPAYPCVKGEGLCQLRVTGEEKFACTQELRYCRYLVRVKSEKGIE